uniref:Uncharacterized protein n=1 Tax=Melopsittacus undulatus TaxID=13146 RepID=A0A8C6IXQ8_MELUD
QALSFQRSLLQACITLALYIRISHPVCHFQGTEMNYHNMKFLCKMGGYFSQQCLGGTTDFRCPIETTKVTKNNVTLIIYEFLQQIFQLFSKNLPAGELEICLSEEQPKARKNFQTWILKRTRLSVKKYFQRITNFLKDKQYSHCSWEAVQVELRTCLIIFDSLMKKHTP